MRIISNINKKADLLTKDIKIQKLRKSSADDFVKLFNKTYKRKIDRKYVFWRAFSENSGNFFFEARQNDKLAGIFGLQLNNTSGKKYSLCLLVDWIISEDFRNIGLILKFLEFAVSFCRKRKVDAVYLFPNDKFYNILMHLGRWKPVDSVYTYIYKQKLKKTPPRDSIMQEIKGEAGARMYNSYNSLKNILFKKADTLRVEKEAQWRYLKNPWHLYKFASDRKNLLVYKIFISPGDKKKYVDIVDFMCNRQDKENLTIFFKDAAAYLKKLKTDYISIWATSNSLLAHILPLFDFQAVTKRYFMMRLLNLKSSDLLKSEKWHIAQSDSEMF